MKKGTKIGITIGSVALVVIIALVLTLSLITTKPLENLASYQTARVYQNSTTNGYPLTDNINKNKSDKLRSILKNCSYSVMQSIFSGRVDTENENYYKDGEVVEFTQTELTGEGSGLYTSYDTSLPKLKLSFGEVKKAKIGSKTYEFDSVEILVADTHGEIKEITCIAWNDKLFEGGGEETQEISFPVFKIHANTTDLYNFIKNECK